MNEKKVKNDTKNIIIIFLVACFVALLMGLFVRPYVVKASAPEDATLTDAQEKLKDIQQFRSDLDVASGSDAVDKSPYLTNDTSPLPLQTNDLLLSIRNILVCIWFTITFFWIYNRLKAVICRLSGVKKNE